MKSVDRSLGMTIMGQTGFGKTAFLHNLIMEDIQEGRTSIVIDPHGDLATDILESAPADHANNVSILEVSEEMPFGLNLYECENRKSQLAIDRVVDNSILVFKRLMQSEKDFHPHIEFLLRNTAYTILDNPTLTMAAVSLMFAQSEGGKLFRANLLKRISDIDLHNFWQGVEDRKGNLAYQYIEPLLNKVSPFTASQVMRLIVGQQHTTIPFSEFLDQPGKTLIVNFPIGMLGEEKTQMLGMTFLSILSEHIYERVNQRKTSRVPVHLYIDEAGLFFSSGTAISKLLKQGRKFGCATHLSFQTLSDLPDREAQSAVLQTGTLVFFQVIGGTDAEILSKQLQVKQPPVDPVPKMRMEPNIKRWTEYVWTDPEKEEEYNSLIAEAKEFGETANGMQEIAETIRKHLPIHVRGLIEEKAQSIYKTSIARKAFQEFLDMQGEEIHKIAKRGDLLLQQKGMDATKFTVVQLNEFIEKLGYGEWLQKRVKAYYTQVVLYEQFAREKSAKAQEIYATYYQKREHEEQDGWLPVKLEESYLRGTTRDNYSRSGPQMITSLTTGTKEIQIYDMVEGTPRPFADLWNQMQANLATLPPYHYYMQTISEQQEIVESQQRSAEPPKKQNYGSEQAEEIRQRSLLYFGRPAEQIRRGLQAHLSPFLDGSDDDKPDTGKSGPKTGPKTGPKIPPPISGAKPYP